MQCDKFIPTADEERTLGVKPFWWIYGTGEEIIDAYGNKMNKHLMPNKEYFGLYLADEINEDELYKFVIYSNKWDLIEKGEADDYFTDERGWFKANSDFHSVGKCVTIHGHKCINSLPFGVKKVAIVYDTTIHNMVVVPSYRFRYNASCKRLFDNIISIYGELTDCYNIRSNYDWTPLNIFPCSEFASCTTASYMLAYGWQVSKILKVKPKGSKLNNVVKYIVIKIDPTDSQEERIFVCSDKWKYPKHDKVQDWMEDGDNTINNVWRKDNYSGAPCTVNGRKCIIIYPFNCFNPVLWDTETDAVYVMPSKAYTGHPYYREIEAHFGGKLSVYK